MKKITIVLIIGMLIITTFSSVGISIHDDTSIIETRQIYFTREPTTYEQDGYLHITYDGTNGYLDIPGKPTLPLSKTVFEFSKNTKILDVSLTHSQSRSKTISSKIVPASDPSITSYPDPTEPSDQFAEDRTIYDSNELYPSTWFDYSIKCGLNENGEDTTFVIVDVYPIRYQPLEGMIQYLSNAKINIAFQAPSDNTDTQTINSFDLLIITPETFVNPLQPLVEHKESIDITTTVKTVEDILSEYSGRDQPEQIKYFIKDAKENYGITSVLLVGGLKSYIYAKDKEDRNHGSTNGWHVPVRYTNIRHSNEVGVISDLYYSDLYRYNEETAEWEFEDWNSNGDDIFANGGVGAARDILDLMPDLYVGRLACRTTFEVNTLVNKIIQYESTSPDEKPWYTRMIGMAGRTFDLFDGLDQVQQTATNYTTLSHFEWQEFEPRKETLSHVELFLRSIESSSSMVTVSLEKPLGLVLASDELLSSDISSEGFKWTSFDFGNALVTPGEKYFITIACDTTTSVECCYAQPALPGMSRYDQGISSLGEDLDWCFKTYDLPEGVEQADGEYSVDTAFRYMEPIIDEEVRVYWSNDGTGQPVPETQDIIDAFNEGAGYINMEGHGNPLSWATHPIPADAPFTGGVSITDFPQIKNGEKLPIVVVGGCHNALFNVSLIKTIIGRSQENWYWTSGYITPICFCWALCASPVGGAIASTGCTGLGLGGSPPDLENSGGLDCNFFYEVGQGATSLGQAHSGAISKYILENSVVGDEIFCIVEFHLFGDPSLVLGGVS
jgi:hypothetical protein